MFHLPRTGTEWLIAVISAVVAFFTGGAIVAGTQAFLRRVL
jgi:hypothetical protein